MTKTDYVKALKLLLNKLQQGELTPEEDQLVVELTAYHDGYMVAKNRLQLLRDHMRETDWMHFCDDHPEAKTWGLD